MEQEKIGRFIQELRKEKNMTQLELGERLGVTDRAISKWENGRGMPDLSLIKPLCKELDITINELLSGERIKKEEYQEKLEENILNTIKYTDKKIKKNNNVFKMIIGSVLTLIITFITLFSIDIKRMNNNEPVFFSTWGFLYAPAIDLHEIELELAIKNYLVSNGDDESKHHNNEKTFVGIRTYLIEEIKEDKLYNIYAWVLEEKYYLENNKIKQDSGSSIPYKFIIEQNGDEFKVIDSRIPRDGSYYAIDMKNIFPKSVRNDMEKVHIDGTIETLSIEVLEQVKLYFHK